MHSYRSDIAEVLQHKKKNNLMKPTYMYKAKMEQQIFFLK